MRDTEHTEASDGEQLYGVLAEFSGPDELIEGAKVVRAAGYKHWDCYSPFPVHGIDPAMGIKRTILPMIVFGGGAAGCALGLFLQWWTNAYDWPWIVSGKPFFSVPANIPVTFETTVLLAAFAAFFGMWILNRLPQFWHPFFRSREFTRMTDDGFFIGIQARDDEFDRGETETMLERAGSTAVEHIHLDPDPRKKRIPQPLIIGIAITTMLALIPFAYIARARAKRSPEPHVHIIPDMDFQFKTLSQSLSVNFEDGRGSRKPVAGTVASGELKADSHFYRGIVQRVSLSGDGRDGQKTFDAWATTFPARFELSSKNMQRGQERFDVFCAPCHGAVGMGDGMIDKRAKQVEGTWSPPTSLHLEHIVTQPHGQIFNTISNGARAMRGYAAQIPEHDRWAIVFYMRALQRSQLTRATDAPDGKLGQGKAAPAKPAPTPPAPAAPADGAAPAEGAQPASGAAPGAVDPASGAAAAAGDNPAGAGDKPAAAGDQPAAAGDKPAPAGGQPAGGASGDPKPTGGGQ